MPSQRTDRATRRGRLDRPTRARAEGARGVSETIFNATIPAVAVVYGFATELADQCRRVGGARLELSAPVVERLVNYACSIGRQRSADELAQLVGRADAASAAKLGHST